MEATPCSSSSLPTFSKLLPVTINLWRLQKYTQHLGATGTHTLLMTFSKFILYFFTLMFGLCFSDQWVHALTGSPITIPKSYSSMVILSSNSYIIYNGYCSAQLSFSVIVIIYLHWILSPILLHSPQRFNVLPMFSTAGSLLHSKVAHPAAHPLTDTIHEHVPRPLWNLTGTLL